MADAITPSHPRWPEFHQRLTNLLQFQGTTAEDYTWRCGKSEDRYFYTQQLALEMGFVGINVPHACCDCEIVFNYEPKD